MVKNAKIKDNLKKNTDKLLSEEEIHRILEEVKPKKSQVSLIKSKYCKNLKVFYHSLQKYRIERALNDKNLNQRCGRLAAKVKKALSFAGIHVD